MSWTDTVIWWHVYPLGFVGAERKGIDHVEHRLGQLVEWLDPLVALGANGLLLGPVFASSSHGYDTLDHFRIDPRLGDEGDFDRLVREASGRGVRILVDGVFNHVGRDHPIVQRALAGGPGSDDGAWIKWSGEYPYCFEGSLDLVELDLDHPPVQDHVVAIMTHWLDRGIDGWRLDAAYAAGAGTWRPIVDRVRSAHPDCWLLAEVIHGDYADFVRTSGVDSVTQYELWKATWSSLNDHNFHELAWTLGRHADLLDTFVPQVFIGNHDVTRIATRLEDPRNLRVALALLFLVPGIPSVYAGDEQGFTGEKTDGPTGDDAVRPAFPAEPGEFPPAAQRVFHDHQRFVHLRRTNPWLTRARYEVGEVTEETIVIEFEAEGQRLGLALNVSDSAVGVRGRDGTVSVPPHDAVSW